MNSELIMPNNIHIEVVSDIVCPWCYIGKRRLEQALVLFAQQHPDIEAPQLSWLPFQLNPDLPAQGMSRADYLQRKFGASDGGGVYERVSAEGKKEGLDFNFSAIARQPNTLKSHALIAAAAAAALGIQSQLKEALMQAYFMQGADMTDDAQLLRIAVQSGMPQAEAERVLRDPAGLQAIAELDADIRQQGINGVPFFILNRRIGISGAQPPQALLAAMEQALG
jgi:predicted DsbA family dithiol-disulfide isomerase